MRVKKEVIEAALSRIVHEEGATGRLALFAALQESDRYASWSARGVAARVEDPAMLIAGGAHLGYFIRLEEEAGMLPKSAAPAFPAQTEIDAVIDEVFDPKGEPATADNHFMDIEATDKVNRAIRSVIMTTKDTGDPRIIASSFIAVGWMLYERALKQAQADLQDKASQLTAA